MRHIALTIFCVVSIFQIPVFSETVMDSGLSSLKLGETSGDSAFSENSKVSIPINIAQSLLLPAYGSFKSENYLLSSMQLCLDLMPLFLLVTSDWSGEKSMGIIALPAIWAINRVAAVPLNGVSAFVHNFRIDIGAPVRYLPTFSDKSHLGFVLILGSNHSLPVDNGGLFPGILIKSGHVRTMLSLPPFSINGSDEYSNGYSGQGYDEFYLVKYKSGVHLTATMDYRFRFHKSMCINPGLTIDFFESSYSYYRLVGGQEELQRDYVKMSYLIGPKVSFEITRFDRFTIEHTIFLPVAVEPDFSNYNKRIDRKIPPIIYTLSLNMLIF
jgi:hypothetical protein